MPINPNTTLGIEARISTNDFRMCLRNVGATSAINIADAIPSGTQMRIAPKVTYNEPRKSGIMPNFGGSDIGSQCIPSKNPLTGYTPNKDSESFSKNRKIKKTNAMTTRPLSLMQVSIIYSLILLCNVNSYRHKAGFFKLLLALR